MTLVVVAVAAAEVVAPVCLFACDKNEQFSVLTGVLTYEGAHKLQGGVETVSLQYSLGWLAEQHSNSQSGSNFQKNVHQTFYSTGTPTLYVQYFLQYW